MTISVDGDVRQLLAEMRRVRAHVEAEGSAILHGWQPMLKRPAFRPGATNLAHYLAFREIDLRPLQKSLVTLGLSGLGRSESRVMATLDAVIANLATLCGEPGAATGRPGTDHMWSGVAALKSASDALFGPPVDGRETRILVTMSPKAAKNAEHVEALVKAGMDAARINCAHDGTKAWTKMIENIRASAAAHGRSCPILMDLQGPKIRTRTVLIPEDGDPVEAGDHILITFGEPEPRRDFPYQASCAMPDVLRQVAAGAKVSIKDGLIVGHVEEVRPEGLLVAVTRTPPDGQPLETEKGINFPGTTLTVSPLSAEDLEDLDFVAEHADMVGYSFVQSKEDVALLQAELEKRRAGRPPLAIVAKIETQLAFRNLPEIIAQAAGANPFAVMIARGDLAVELGFERMSEVPRQILALCEAAHVPAIWATQVLESMAKTGQPSRA
ncbi:MAG TPA: pyruvate kinase, partial [Rhodospirillales bacterium]|nr:pyruvate kinase [Rhodospirillales bacterium]